MAQKRKISVRKVLQALLTLVAVTGCAIAMSSASRVEDEKLLAVMPVIDIDNGRQYQFIEQEEVMDRAIYKRNVDIMHTPISRLDLRGMEQAIMADPWVSDAQVFVGIDRVMHIKVTQRVPVARLFRQDGDSYYIDATLHTMPLSDNYTFYTTMVTNVPILHNDSVGNGMKASIVKLVCAIQADTFWKEQVSQVVIDSANMFVLMPVLGDQQIMFGDTSRIRPKLDALMAFYRNVLNKIGWDKYDLLDVRFRDQVVASPSLPYKGPLDKAVGKMNWITSIEVGEEDRRRRDDSIQAAALVKARALALRQAAERKAEERAAKKGLVKKGAAKKTPATPAKARGAVAKAPAKKVPAAKTATAAKGEKPKAAPVADKQPARPAEAAAAVAGSAAQKPEKTTLLKKAVKAITKPFKKKDKEEKKDNGNKDDKKSDKKTDRPAEKKDRTAKYSYPEKRN